MRRKINILQLEFSMRNNKAKILKKNNLILANMLWLNVILSFPVLIQYVFVHHIQTLGGDKEHHK